MASFETEQVELFGFLLQEVDSSLLEVRWQY
jgi:hypothetical protein